MALLNQPSISQSETSPNLQINHPENESNVDQFGEYIEFRANSTIDNNYVPVVFIKDPNNQWWPWLLSRPLGERRMNWRLNNTQFGEAKDGGLDFQIQILIIPRRDIDNGIILQEGNSLFIEAGEPIKNRAYITILKNRYPTQSNVVVVKRN